MVSVHEQISADLLAWSSRDEIETEVREIFADEPYAEVCDLIDFEAAHRPQFVAEAIAAAKLGKETRIAELDEENAELRRNIDINLQERNELTGDPEQYQPLLSPMSEINEQLLRDAQVRRMTADERVALWNDDFRYDRYNEEIPFTLVGKKGSHSAVTFMRTAHESEVRQRFGEQIASRVTRATTCLTRGYRDLETGVQRGYVKLIESGDCVALVVTDPVAFANDALCITNFGLKGLHATFLLADLQREAAVRATQPVDSDQA